MIGLARANAAFEALSGCTWCGRPQRDPALCHHAWRVRQWVYVGAGTFWFTGSGFDSLGLFDVRGCANPCVPDGTTRLAWSQTYIDRLGVVGVGRQSFEFRGVFALDADGESIIRGTWNRHMADGVSARPGDILHGEFVLAPASSDQRQKGEVAATSDDSKGDCFGAHAPPAEPARSQPHIDG